MQRFCSGAIIVVSGRPKSLKLATVVIGYKLGYIAYKLGKANKDRQFGRKVVAMFNMI